MRDSTLCLQGPPGTGKTYTAAKMIEALLAEGKRVGVMSNSHKAIFNLLSQVNRNLDGALEGIKVGKEENEEFFAAAPGVAHIEVSSDAAGAYQGGIAAGTAWLFARPEWVGNLDYLFVDEAGQVSLANVVAVSRSASNIVLMGDQMQLEQPVQGSHPGESGQSALNYYLRGHATIPSGLGLFLPVTRRMHPEICRFISELVYEGRLLSAPGTERRAIDLPASSPIKKSAGLIYVPVEHEGNVQASDEEVEVIVTMANSLIGAPLRGPDGKVVKKVSWDDILFVCPYNLQVRRLRAALPNGARVGSVDKFQGQEAAVVFVSMCSSFGEYGSRGLGFILDPNRINVAISRAQILAIVVGDPRIANAPAASIDEMRRINLYCRLTR